MSPALILAGFVGACAAAIASVLVSARKFSGKIDSTEASELWEESRSIREDYRTRIEVLERENAELREGRSKDRERIARLEARLKQLEGDDVPGYLS